MTASHSELANALRALAMDAVQAANSGHPGMPMGMADVAVVLFGRFLKFSAGRPDWPDRDRFVLSAGHGSMLLYGLLHLCGYEDFPLEELRRFRQLGGRTAGHPEFGHGRGIETTTGPLGQGLANGVGMALAERLLADEYGESVSNHRTWVVAGDGCLMEGISHEAASLAGHLRLGKLIVLFDDNGISIDGRTSLSVSDDHLMRFKAYGWQTLRCDGHDESDVAAAMEEAVGSGLPSLIACRTRIGYGAPNKQGTAAAHGAPLGEEEVEQARARLGWTAPAFEIPDAVRAVWREIGGRGDDDYEAWRRRLAEHPKGEDFRRRVAGELPADWDANLRDWEERLGDDPDGGKMATRQASGQALAALVPSIPALLGGSADLTGSNNTHVGQSPVSADAFGRYLHYGVREHGMAAVMNGLALHGGFIPYGGTFLVFSDYCRPAIRLSALMGAQVIYVMTHDSIGLGEDGPTHQPIEHLAALRALPGLSVFRPCDAAETAACWRLALQRRTGPSLLALSRQALPMLSGGAAAGCRYGGYVLSEAPTGRRQMTLVASGSEVSLACQAQRILADRGIGAAVVSMPCMGLFQEQEEDWRLAVIPAEAPVLAIEAAVAMPWQALATLLGWRRFDCLCLDTFGVSAPMAEVYRHLGMTVDACVERAEALLAADTGH